MDNIFLDPLPLFSFENLGASNKSIGAKSAFVFCWLKCHKGKQSHTELTWTLCLIPNIWREGTGTCHCHWWHHPSCAVSLAPKLHLPEHISFCFPLSITVDPSDVYRQQLELHADHTSVWWLCRGWWSEARNSSPPRLSLPLFLLLKELCH